MVQRFEFLFVLLVLASYIVMVFDFDLDKACLLNRTLYKEDRAQPREDDTFVRVDLLGQFE